MVNEQKTGYSARIASTAVIVISRYTANIPLKVYRVVEVDSSEESTNVTIMAEKWQFDFEFI